MRSRAERPQCPSFSIKTFTNVEDSVAGYLHNLNTHARYAEFRRVRSEQRAKGRALDSLELAETLTAYSEQRSAYVSDIKAMIAQIEVAAAPWRLEPFDIGAQSEAGRTRSTRRQARAGLKATTTPSFARSVVSPRTRSSRRPAWVEKHVSVELWKVDSKAPLR